MLQTDTTNETVLEKITLPPVMDVVIVKPLLLLHLDCRPVTKLQWMPLSAVGRTASKLKIFVCLCIPIAIRVMFYLGGIADLPSAQKRTQTAILQVVLAARLQIRQPHKKGNQTAKL